MIPLRLIHAVYILAVLSATGTLRGQTAWYESFEAAETSWRGVGANVPNRILDHRRIQGEAHTGKASEWLRLAANNDSNIQIAHDVGRPRVIDELMPSVWIKSDRAGLQIAARILLPRTIDPQTGRPQVAIVTGSSYTDTGRWQELRITDVPRLLAEQIRLLRTQLGPNVDGREAYVDAILLNIYSGPSVTNVWIDDLDIAGYVGLTPPSQSQVVNPAAPAGNAIDGRGGWAPKGSGTGSRPSGSAGQYGANEPASGSSPASGRPLRPRARCGRGAASARASTTPCSRFTPWPCSRPLRR